MYMRMFIYIFADIYKLLAFISICTCGSRISTSSFHSANFVNTVNALFSNVKLNKMDSFD